MTDEFEAYFQQCLDFFWVLGDLDNEVFCFALEKDLFYLKEEEYYI